MSDQPATSDRITATRTVAAGADEVFAVLADPARHPDTEPGDWVRAARDPQPITGVGQVFGMDMHHPSVGDYVIHSAVTVFEPGRAIAWQPGQYDEQGAWGSGGWWWRYDLEPVGDGTRVSLSYDWADVPEPVRESFGGFPVIPPGFLDESLAALDAAVAPR
ncbi:ATPase [Nocardioides sp. HDW12B]|uniref:SRPBCC family protein n=1 Tax=Nocardioides sp. HDW12B TaxID=2714939 RepID=UPI0014088B45|nr:SRPBCC family protein [Nocardioides sp. HDW12B]QIK67835.1 ATPase [Nocardioides sp. HDW12B]